MQTPNWTSNKQSRKRKPCHNSQQIRWHSVVIRVAFGIETVLKAYCWSREITQVGVFLKCSQKRLNLFSPWTEKILSFEGDLDFKAKTNKRNSKENIKEYIFYHREEWTHIYMFTQWVNSRRRIKTTDDT